MNCLVIFADPDDIAVRVLLPVILDEALSRTDIKRVAVFLTAQTDTAVFFRHYLRNWLSRPMQVLLGSGRNESALKVLPLSLRKLKGNRNISIFIMPDRDPNHLDVLTKIHRDLKADIAINIYCKKLFRESLLSSFKTVVNYHNGKLPFYRGLRATNWSIYQGDKTSGYCFHHMQKEFDTGNMLISGEVPVDQKQTPADLELRKAQDACYSVPGLFDMMLAHEKGQSQAGIGCEHNYQAFQLMAEVQEPSLLTRAEWERRLFAFLRIKTRLSGNWWPVTGVVRCKGPGKLSFRTADGYWLRVSSLDFWPAWSSKAYRRL